MDRNRAKSLDHIVLPVASLQTARVRLSALGFTVAPDGHHPFGTENACVFFENGSYFEPLAIGAREVYDREADKGNGFLRRDRQYRQRNGENGFSLIALTSDDAAAERTKFQALGFDCGPIVSFCRNVEQPDGSNRQISINLFITASENSPDLALFSCQWLSDKVFDPSHKIHANGATGIAAIMLAGAKSDESVAYLGAITGQVPSGGENAAGFDNSVLPLANANILMMTDDEIKQAYGVDAISSEFSEASTPRAVAIDVTVSDIFYTAVVLRISGIASKQIGKRLVVAPSDGQGYILAFIQQDTSS